MTMFRNQFSQLLALGVRANFVEFNELKQRPQEFPDIFNVAPSDSAYEDEVIYSGMGAAPEKGEGESFFYQDMVQGGTKRYIHLTYGLGARYSWELGRDDKYGFVKQVPKALVRAGKFSEEMIPFNVLNLGFSTIVTADGVSLFHNQHPLLGGPAATAIGPGVSNIIAAAGTFPNRPSTDVDLSFTALQLMSNQFERMIDQQGIPVVVRPSKIVVPPELRFIAEELLKSEYKPYTSDNEKNSLMQLNLSYMIGHFLTSQSAWFALAPKEDTQLKVYQRTKLQSDEDDDFDTRSVKQVSFQSLSAGATHWVGTWGSNGP
jgi:phage major head subunit gpT-like protein